MRDPEYNKYAPIAFGLGVLTAIYIIGVSVYNSFHPKDWDLDTPEERKRRRQKDSKLENDKL